MDKIGHLALQNNQHQLVETFGQGILTDGIIDRKKLGNLVFNHKLKLKKLNRIVHPWMVTAIKNMLSTINENKILIDAALLFQMQLHTLCDTILIVKSPLIDIFKRGVQRDHHSIIKIYKILTAQNIPKWVKRFSKQADIYTIKNSRDLVYLNRQIDDFINGSFLI